MALDDDAFTETKHETCKLTPTKPRKYHYHYTFFPATHSDYVQLETFSQPPGSTNF